MSLAWEKLGGTSNPIVYSYLDIGQKVFCHTKTTILCETCCPVPIGSPLLTHIIHINISGPLMANLRRGLWEILCGVSVDHRNTKPPGKQVRTLAPSRFFSCSSFWWCYMTLPSNSSFPLNEIWSCNFLDLDDALNFSPLQLHRRKETSHLPSPQQPNQCVRMIGL